MAATHEDRNAQLSPGVAIKAPCKAATIAAITLSGEQTVDGVALVSGDRCLVKNQVDQTTNGIYGVNTGTWVREPDFDGTRDVVTGTFVFITNGATNAGAFYECTTTGTIVFGTSNLTFAVGALGPIAIPIPATNVQFTQSGAGAVARTVQDKERDVVSVKDFGAKGDGVTNDAAAFNAFFTALSVNASGSTQDGSVGVIPRGNYFFSSQVTFTLPNFGRSTILAGGAEITTSGAISGLQITGGATGGGATIIGLQINHRGNTTATFGFDLIHAGNVTLDRCYVRAHNVQAAYAAYHLANSNAADDSTGSLWNVLQDCGEGMDGGGDGTNIPFGVLMEGASNANTIRGGQYGRNTTVGIKLQNMTAQVTVPNGCVIDGAFIEGYTTAIQVSNAAGQTSASGLRVVNCRFESGTTVFSLTGATLQPETPTFMSGNYSADFASAGTYLNNPNAIKFTSLDNRATALSFTPTISFTTVGDLAVAYSTQVGRYNKIANRIFFNIHIVTSSFTYTTSAGSFFLTGLPENPASSGGEWVVTTAFQGYTKANFTQVTGDLSPSDTRIFFNVGGSGQVSTLLQTADVPSAGALIIKCNGSYPV